MTIKSPVIHKFGKELLKNTVFALKWTVLSMIIAISFVFAVAMTAKVYEYFL